MPDLAAAALGARYLLHLQRSCGPASGPVGRACERHDNDRRDARGSRPSGTCGGGGAQVISGRFPGPSRCPSSPQHRHHGHGAPHIVIFSNVNMGPSEGSSWPLRTGSDNSTSVAYATFLTAPRAGFTSVRACRQKGGSTNARRRWATGRPANLCATKLSCND